MKQTLNSHPEEEPNREIAALMESERPHLLRYACYRLGNADDAEDAVQDIFLQLHTKRQDAGGQPLADLRSYLYRSLSNFCTDRLRRRQVREFVPIEQVSHICEEQVENFNESSGLSRPCWRESPKNKPKSSGSASTATTVSQTLPPFWTFRSRPPNPDSSTESKKSEKESNPKVQNPKKTEHHEM